MKHIEDIWNESINDVSNQVKGIHINEENKNYELEFNANKMEEIKTRPSYPADKTTFAIKNGEFIRTLEFNFRNNRKYDINVILEDNKRNEVNYF